MEKAAKKINKNYILNVIKEEAEFLIKKDEYLKKVKNLNDEIKNLYENRSFAGTFGFAGDDSQKSKSGFVNPQNISYIAQLEKEFGAEDSSDDEGSKEINEVTELQKENENLKKQLEEIAAFMKTMKADQDK
jgi:hypothetical protein